MCCCNHNRNRCCCHATCRRCPCGIRRCCSNASLNPCGWYECNPCAGIMPLWLLAQRSGVAVVYPPIV